MEPNDNYSGWEPQKPVVENQAPKVGGDLSITSLVLGILSLVFCWGCGLPIISGSIGAVLGVVSLLNGTNNRGMAIAGIITSLLGAVLSAAMIVLYIFL